MAKKFQKNQTLAEHIASLHIKKNTASTSNELSLSVLDALSSRASDKQTPSGATQPLGGVSLFTLGVGRKNSIPTPLNKPALPSSANISSTDKTGADIAGMALDISHNAAAQAARNVAENLPDPEKEIARRKKRRRVRRALATCFGIAACVVFIGGFGLFVNNEYTTHQRYVSQLNNSLDVLMASDELIVDCEQIIGTNLLDDKTDKLQGLIGQIDMIVPEVKEASQEAAEVVEGMRESTDREAARQSLLAADARVVMFTEAENILSLRIQALECANTISRAWADVLKADSLAKEAAQLVSDTTVENTQDSQQKTEDAIAVFSHAQELLYEATSIYDSVDVSALIAYVDKRIEAMGYALNSDNAIYVQDKITAETYNDYYNAAEQEAVEMAKSLPKDVATLAVEAYEADVVKFVESYTQARSEAATADAFLRDYVGTAS